jgi:nitrous oxidase accessory protein
MSCAAVPHARRRLAMTGRPTSTANRRCRHACALVLALAALLAGAPAAASDGLEAAVHAAAAGAVLRVPAGVHAVHLLLQRPITLEGEPGAVLDGSGSGDVVRIRSSGVTLRNLVIRRSGRDLTAMNAGVFVEGSSRDVSIADNRIEDVLFGVYLDGAANVRVERNTITGLPALRVSDRGDGIHLWNDTGCTIAGNDVSATRDGIYVYVSPHNTITDNRVHGVRYGIHYMYSHYNTLRGNVSSGNVAGYALMSSDHLKVLDNVSRDQQAYGYLLNYISYSDIRGNQSRGVNGQLDDNAGLIDGADGKGMFVYLSQFNTIADNVLTDSQIGIHVTAGSEHNLIHGNAFIANRVQVKYVQNIAEEWSERRRGNYWSDYLGWDMNGDGIGDVAYRPNDGVDVLLWKYPSARALMSSPAILLLRYVQRAFPVFTPPAVQDSFRLLHAPTTSQRQADAQHH